MLSNKPSFFNALSPPSDSSLQDLSQGLLASGAHCSPKYFYNALGSTLFDAITHLPEYYLTRTEAAIFGDHAEAIHGQISAQATWLDLGAGSCEKAARLFERTPPGLYVAVDISLTYLTDTLERLQREHPQVPMMGVGMDFSSALTFPPSLHAQLLARPVFAFYPGSSLGNFDPVQALGFLQRVATVCNAAKPGSGLLIGIDLVKDTAVLERAYADDLGVTAAFNLNVLRHMNTLLSADFDVRDWQHLARFNVKESRIEMHLQARREVTVSWSGHQRVFQKNETIHTENSYKWTVEKFSKLLRSAGFAQTQHWTDQQQQYAVFWAS
jgi:dimethylhistidine N-methyltransferase